MRKSPKVDQYPPSQCEIRKGSRPAESSRSDERTAASFDRILAGPWASPQTVTLSAG
ncbi:MAG: hypothetical protein ABIJ65_09480 [Chloroflexota bacterium]